jgi:hypothetical protein
MNLRKILPWLLLTVLIVVVGTVLYNRDREVRLYPQATIGRIVEGEKEWYESGISSYKIRLEVEFSSERRRHEIIVRDFQYFEGTTEFASGTGWSDPVPMDAEEGDFLTVVGLFSTTRSALQGGVRQDVLMQLHEAPVYPEIVFLGDVVQDGFVIAGTQTTITVLSFEPLD